MKVRLVINTLYFVLVSISMQAQYLSSHIEHFSYETSVHNIKFVLAVSENSNTPDSLHYNTGDGSPFKVIHKTNSIELKNSVSRLEYSFSHAFPGTAGLVFNSLNDSSYFFEPQNYSPVDSGYHSHVSFVDLFFVDGQSSVLFQDYLVKQVAPGELLIMNPIADINILPDYPLPQFDEPGLHFELGEWIDDNQYQLPEGMTIHPQTGEIRWTVPDNSPTGLYELFIGVEKQFTWGGESLKRLVFNVSDTIPEGILYYGLDDWETDTSGYYEYHIPPDENFQLQFSMEHNEADSINVVSHSETYLPQNGASFSNSIANEILTTTFSWTPNTSHIRTTPYVVHFVPSFTYNGYCYYDFISISIFVDHFVGFKESGALSEIDVYPNPCTTQFSLELKQETSKPLDMAIYTLTGQQVIAEQLSGNQRHTIDVSGLEAGMYIVQLMENGQPAGTAKLVVQGR